MKLTEDNQDGMDCRPLGRATGIVTPPAVRAALEASKAKRQATTAKPSAKPSHRTPRAAE